MNAKDLMERISALEAKKTELIEGGGALSLQVYLEVITIQREITDLEFELLTLQYLGDNKL